MSELTTILSGSIQDRAPATADTVTNLATGAKFQAEIEYNLDPLTLPVQYIDDPREKIRLHVTDYNQASSITKGNLIQLVFAGRTSKFEIIDGYASRARFQSSFLAVEKVPGIN